MAITFSDEEIAAFIQERKPLSEHWTTLTRLRRKRGHEERELDARGDRGGEFRLILRRSAINLFDFSVILAVRVPESTQVFRLRRYNGRSHQHRNRIEGDIFFGHHVHMATERYQALGAREDAYAEPTDRYGDYIGALRCLVEDAHFIVPSGIQPGLLDVL